MDKPRTIAGLLQKPEFPAGRLLQRGRFLQKLEHLISKLLDNEMSLHCRVGNLRDGLLILYTESPAWGSRLRFQIPALLKQLQAHKGLEGIQGIELRVVPEEEKVYKNQRASLSKDASSCIAACAETVASDDLRKALQQLASHHRKKES